MGAIFATGFCAVCCKIVFFNPQRVPSIGSEPVCASCMDHVNALRSERGLQPVEVPHDAYAPEEV